MSDDHYFSADPSVAFAREDLECEVWGHTLRLTSGAGFADLVVNANDTITTLSSSTSGVPVMRRLTATGANDASFSFTVTGLNGTPSGRPTRRAGLTNALRGERTVPLGVAMLSRTYQMTGDSA